MRYYLNDERGIESYNALLSFDMISFLKSVQQKGITPNWLDIGCGKGRCIEEVLSILEREDVPIKVCAIDSRQTKLFSDNVTFRRMRAEQIKEIGMYDLITASFVLPYIKNPIKVIERTYNALRVEGLAAMTLFRENIRINEGYIGSKDCPIKTTIEESGGKLSIYHNPAAIHLIRGTDPIDLSQFYRIGYLKSQE